MRPAFILQIARFTLQEAVSRRLILAGVVISLGYVVRLYDDQDVWRSAAHAQQAELASIDHQLPRLPTGSSLVTFGYPGDFVRGLPIFDSTWDLAGALRLRRQDNSLRALPLFEEGRPECSRSGFRAVYRNESNGPREIAYGRLFFVSPRAAVRIADRQACQQALHLFRPGQYVLHGDQPVTPG